MILQRTLCQAQIEYFCIKPEKNNQDSVTSQIMNWPVWGKKKKLTKDKKNDFSYAQRKKSQKAVSSVLKKYVIMLIVAMRKKFHHSCCALFFLIEEKSHTGIGNLAFAIGKMKFKSKQRGEISTVQLY